MKTFLLASLHLDIPSSFCLWNKQSQWESPHPVRPCQEPWWQIGFGCPDKPLPEPPSTSSDWSLHLTSCLGLQSLFSYIIGTLAPAAPESLFGFTYLWSQGTALCCRGHCLACLVAALLKPSFGKQSLLAATWPSHDKQRLGFRKEPHLSVQIGW